MCNFGIKMYPKMPIYLTIQKPDFVDRLMVANFATIIIPNAFYGSNFNRWRERVILWLMALNIMHVAKGKPKQFTPEEGSAFKAADNLFRGYVIGVLAENLVYSYIHLKTGKEIWDALESQYGVSDAGSELYVME
jgi:hypothetical protein